MSFITRKPNKPWLPVEKGVPISEFYLLLHKKASKRQIGGRPAKHSYPFHMMEVGDSFVVPSNARMGDVRKMANKYGKEANMEFLLIRDDKHQYRVYRTA